MFFTLNSESGYKWKYGTKPSAPRLACNWSWMTNDFHVRDSRKGIVVQPQIHVRTLSIRKNCALPLQVEWAKTPKIQLQSNWFLFCHTWFTKIYDESRKSGGKCSLRGQANQTPNKKTFPGEKNICSFCSSVCEGLMTTLLYGYLISPSEKHVHSIP